MAESRKQDVLKIPTSIPRADFLKGLTTQGYHIDQVLDDSVVVSRIEIKEGKGNKPPLLD